MGRTHLGAYARAAADGYACRVLAVCNTRGVRPDDTEQQGGNIRSADNVPGLDPAAVRVTSTPDEVLDDPAIDLVSICTYTETHADLAIRALQAGKHVLVEKPVAIRSGDVGRVGDAAHASGRLCMPAMCMRFWPGWRWLRDRVRDGSLGSVHSATFQRLGCRPDWGDGFYADATRCGGALFDLHIHDADFIRWCWGTPQSVTSTGSIDHLTTLYRFASGPAHVAAEGGWDQMPGFEFRMRYVVVFEAGTADWEVGRDPPLLLYRDGSSEAVALPTGTGYDGQIRHLLDAITLGRTDLDATISEARAVTVLLEAERRSIQTGRPVAVAP